MIAGLLILFGIVLFVVGPPLLTWRFGPTKWLGVSSTPDPDLSNLIANANASDWAAAFIQNAANDPFYDPTDYDNTLPWFEAAIQAGRKSA